MIFAYFAFIFIIGLIFGSFANVCIYRIPRSESLLHPGSHCPACNTPIAWYDNVPVLSFLLLGRKCRACSAPISPRYPAVELVTGLAFLLVGIRYPFDPMLAVYLYFTFALIVISAIDLEYMEIPDLFTYSFIAIGLAVSFANPSLGEDIIPRFLNSLAGAVAGGGGLFLAGWIGAKIFKKEAMGGGDVKLLAGIGALLGLPRMFMALFIASLLGSIVGIYLISAGKMQRRQYLPFGPFLAMAGYAGLFLPTTFSWLFAINF